MKNLLCRLGVHFWSFSTDNDPFPRHEISHLEGEDIYRECVICHLKQKLLDDGQASGMASMEDWKTIKQSTNSDTNSPEPATV